MKLSFHRPTSRILIAGTLCLVFLLGTVLGWANTHLLSADSRFEQFTEELFQKEVSGNMLNLHYSLAYPEKKGIQRPKATLGTISLPSSQLTDTSSASFPIPPLKQKILHPKRSKTSDIQSLRSF